MKAPLPPVPPSQTLVTALTRSHLSDERSVLLCDGAIQQVWERAAWEIASCASMHSLSIWLVFGVKPTWYSGGFGGRWLPTPAGTEYIKMRSCVEMQNTRRPWNQIISTPAELERRASPARTQVAACSSERKQRCHPLCLFHMYWFYSIALL